MKKFLLFMMALLTASLLIVPVSAESFDYVIDEANLLTTGQENALQDKLAKLSQEVDADIVVVTVTNLNGQYIRDYADDYYDDNGYADDGVLLLIDMDTRAYWISTTGRCIDDVSVYDLEDAFLSDLSNGYYYDAFSAYADACRDELEPMPLLMKILVCLGIGIVIGLITVFVMKGKLKTVRNQSGADSYMRYDAVNITHQSDMFLYQTVTRRPKPQNNGTHTGSSGRSHGGGGGRF